MFFFRGISLIQFRNYPASKFRFAKRVVGICGKNGSGKTNLLDALYYLSFTRSYFSRPDVQNITHGLQGMRIEGDADYNGDDISLVCIIRENNRKEFSANNILYTRFSEHVGKFPCVMIAPDDVRLINEGSEERRKFLDTLLSQLYPGYLKQLIDYTKILQQRNGLLKAAAERNYVDEALLDTLDEQLAERAQFIYEKRRNFLIDFIPLVKQQYETIAVNHDNVELVYDSQLQRTNIKDLLRQNRQRDLYLQRTGCGIHKDDIIVEMKGEPFKTLASQGQRKSLLFALKLAEFTTLKQHKGFAPVLLLDDVFEKLDETRMHNLLQRVCVQEEGQVFITDTHRERLQQSLHNLGSDYQLIEL